MPPGGACSRATVYRTWLWRILLQSCWETCMLNYPSEMSVHQCMKYWENTEELEICVWSQGHDLIATTEIWWDSSHDWDAIRDGYVLFREDRPGRQGGRVALSVREQLECIKLCLGVDKEWVKCLWVRIKGQANMGDCCGCLLQATWSGSQWGLLQIAG